MIAGAQISASAAQRIRRGGTAPKRNGIAITAEPHEPVSPFAVSWRSTSARGNPPQKFPGMRQRFRLRSGADLLSRLIGAYTAEWGQQARSERRNTATPNNCPRPWKDVSRLLGAYAAAHSGFWLLTSSTPISRRDIKGEALWLVGLRAPQPDSASPEPEAAGSGDARRHGPAGCRS